MRKNNFDFFQALNLVLGGNTVYSYDGYKLINDKGNIYVRHLADDRKKRLVNQCEIQLLKDKLFYIKDTDELKPYTQNLFR